MANEKNLIPGAHDLTVDEASKGGVNSGKKRRRLRDMKTAMRELLSMPAGDAKDVYEAMGGMKAEPDNQDVMLAALLVAAMQGDVQSIKLVRDIAVDDERIKIEREKLKMLKEKDTGGELDKLDEILGKIT